MFLTNSATRVLDKAIFLILQSAMPKNNMFIL